MDEWNDTPELDLPEDSYYVSPPTKGVFTVSSVDHDLDVLEASVVRAGYTIKRSFVNRFSASVVKYTKV